MLSEKDEVPVSIFASRHDASKTGNLFRSFLRHSTQETNMTDIVSIRHGDELLAIIIPGSISC